MNGINDMLATPQAQHALNWIIGIVIGCGVIWVLYILSDCVDYDNDDDYYPPF